MSQAEEEKMQILEKHFRKVRRKWFGTAASNA
jgi:hypothetical protein